MFDKCRFESRIGMGRYFRDLSIRLVSNEEIIRNSACNLAILLNIPNLKSENSNKIRKISMRIQNLNFLFLFCSSEFALNAILENNQTHSFVICPVITYPLISPMRLTLLQYYPQNPIPIPPCL